MLTNPTPDINQTLGIVIRSHPSGESDLVLKILTPELGKISVFAKNARTSKKRFSGNIEILDRGQFTVKNKSHSKSGLYFIEGFLADKAIYSLRTNLLKLGIASLLCEAFDLIIKEEQDSDDVSLRFYESFCLGIDAIGESEDKSELLKICFLTLQALLCLAGFLDTARSPVPNMKNLRLILNHLEQCVEKKLMTRAEFEKLI